MSEFGQTPSQLFDASQPHPQRQHITPLLQEPLPGYAGRPADGDAVPSVLEHVLQAASAMDPFVSSSPEPPPSSPREAPVPSPDRAPADVRSGAQDGAGTVGASPRGPASEPPNRPQHQAAPTAAPSLLRGMFGSRQSSQTGFAGAEAAASPAHDGGAKRLSEPHVTAMKAQSMEGWLEVTAPSTWQGGRAPLGPTATQAEQSVGPVDAPLLDGQDVSEPGPIEDPAESECPLVAPPATASTVGAAPVPVRADSSQALQSSGTDVPRAATESAGPRLARPDEARTTGAAATLDGCAHGTAFAVRAIDTSDASAQPCMGSDHAQASHQLHSTAGEHTNYRWPPDVHRKLQVCG